ncbi:recombination protein NinG [Xenorhabdus budapestensis]|uniref:Recombination protein NinG n=1 Tax=Xenorhabdus budapestensis TaxID=290110 RepID=A0ABX7VD62_XENBU|nr:recombination protein NinG [Xenorhabdus budapestensis]QTL38774.1 recombination protein NinG [Xenorhabdus budapestensis]
MKKQVRRKCEICRVWFHPKYDHVWWCSPEHGAELGMRLQDKKYEKARQKLERERRQKEVAARDKLKARHLVVKPRSYWIQQAQRAVNTYIRERDRDLPCVSCGTFVSSQWDAGHYRTTPAAPQLRFDERNIHRQCIVCNQHKSGNIVPYRVELIRRIGQAAVDAIESSHDRHRWTIEECKVIKEEYRQKLKELRVREVA